MADEQLTEQVSSLLGSAVRVAAHGIVILTPTLDASGPRIAFVNDGFCAMYGISREEAIGQTTAIFGIVESQQSIVKDLLDHIYDGEEFEGEATARRADGSEFEVDLQLIPVEDAGELMHWVVFLRDITTIKSQVQVLRHQAMHDQLTSLPNRMMLLERFEQAIEKARTARTHVALLLMDLDRFKDINDTFGHNFGDLLLREVAMRMQNQLRPADTVARLGGDEFGIIIPDAADSDSVAARARRILNSLEQPFVINGHVLEVSTSIGIAVYPEHGRDTRTLLRRADVAMYAAKQAQAGYAFHEDGHEQRTAEDLALVVEMRHALERDEFELHYQPKLHLQSGLVTRAEVLVRWKHAQRGLLPPGAFIPIAERTGLIKPLTDWIFDHAIEQCRRWQDDGVPVHLAVNVSASSLLEKTLPTKIHSLLEKWNVEPRFLKVEITESSIMADPSHALAVLSLLQSLGVRLSIDDFGTGYSSLTHLRELPIDEIKIDKSFVFRMTSNDADASIVRTVIDLGHNLGKQVCAEGVEDEETWKMLGDLGCDLAQGYWISRPVPAAKLIDWLVETGWGLALTKRSSQSAAR